MLDDYKAEKTRIINMEITSVRSTLFPSIFGQLELYSEKVQEAIDYAADGYPNDTSQYPFIALEKQLTHKTGKHIVTDIFEKRQQWISVGLKTERVRREFANSIIEATTKQEVDLATSIALTELTS